MLKWKPRHGRVKGEESERTVRRAEEEKKTAGKGKSGRAGEKGEEDEEGDGTKVADAEGRAGRRIRAEEDERGGHKPPRDGH